MDTNHSDSENHIRDALTNPWGAFWDQEDGSDSGLALGMENLQQYVLKGGSTDLGNLVEDKEIAARAVAFVVNSTRKGIVPLCADIASLFCQKRNLEEKVLSLKRQNEVLHMRASATSSLRNSHNASPTPPSLHSHGVDGEHTVSGRPSLSSRPTSSCSQCSGSIGSHGKTSSTYINNNNNNNNNMSSGGNGQTHKRRQSSSSSCDTQTVTTAVVHNPPPDCVSTTTIDINVERQMPPGGRGDNNNLASIVTSEHGLSLPHITSQPSQDLPNMSPSCSQVSREIQCQLLTPNDPKLEEQFRETVRMNSRLAEDLGAARKENEILKGRLKELEMINLARQYTGQYSDSFHLENECSTTTPTTSRLSNNAAGTDSDVSETSTSSLPTSREKPGYRHSLPLPSSPGNSPAKSKPIHRTHGGQIALPTAMPGCKCTLCESTESPRPKTGREVTRVTVNGKLQIQLDDYVVVKGDRTGHIRYIGHLDKIGTPSIVFVGLELDAPVGRHDGNFNGKKYFSCGKDYGVFVAIQDVTCVIKRKHVSKKSKPSAATLVHRSSSESDSTARPLRSKHGLGSDAKRKEAREKSAVSSSVSSQSRSSKSPKEDHLPNGYV